MTAKVDSSHTEINAGGVSCVSTQDNYVNITRLPTIGGSDHQLLKVKGGEAEFSSYGNSASNKAIEVTHGKTVLKQTSISGLGNYADDTAAGSAGLSAGDLYHTSGVLKIKL